MNGKNRATFDEMIQFDIRYARNRCFWLDMQIMLKTLPAVIGQIRDMLRRKKSQHPVIAGKSPPSAASQRNNPNSGG